MQEFCLKRADSDHYNYPECGLKFLVLKGVPKVLNYLERRPKLLMVCQADVLNLVFISRDLCGSMSPLKVKKVHMCVCAQGQPLSPSPAFRRFMTADQMMLIMFAERGKDCFWAPPRIQHFQMQPRHPCPSFHMGQNPPWVSNPEPGTRDGEPHIARAQQQATVSQFRVQISVPAPPSRPDLPEFGHTQELNSACPCGQGVNSYKQTFQKQSAKYSCLLSQLFYF